MTAYIKGGDINQITSKYYKNREKQKERTLIKVDRFLRHNPHNKKAYLLKGNIYLNEENFDKSIKYFEKALEISPNNLEGLNNLAACYVRKANYEKALELLNKVLDKDPEYPTSLINRGRIYYDKGNFKQAFSDMEKYSKQKDLRDDFLFLGILYENKGDPLNAISCYDSYMEIHPDNYYIYGIRGAAYFENGYYDKALSDYNICIENIPDNVYAFISRGENFLKKEDVLKAVEISNELIDKRPDNRDLFINRGYAYFLLQNYENAYSDFSKALEINPDSYLALNNLAAFKCISEDESFRNGEEAIKLARRVCEITENHYLYALNILSCAYAENREYNHAIKLQEEVISRWKGNKDSKFIKKADQKLDLFKSGKPYRKIITFN